MVSMRELNGSAGRGVGGSAKKEKKENRPRPRPMLELRGGGFDEEYPLHAAARDGDFAKVKQLVESGADVSRDDGVSRSSTSSLPRPSRF